MDWVHCGCHYGSTDSRALMEASVDNCCKSSK
jgi:hypothetical protein